MRNKLNNLNDSVPGLKQSLSLVQRRADTTEYLNIKKYCLQFNFFIAQKPTAFCRGKEKNNFF